MLQFINRRIRRSATGRRGAAALEFGLISSLLVSLVLLTLEIVYAMAARGVAEAGLEAASRYAATGAGGSTMGPRMTAYSNKLYSITDSMINRASISTTVTAYPTILDLWNDTPVGGSSDLGLSGEFVTYSLTYNHPLVAGGLLCTFLPFVGCTGDLPMTLRIVRQNEPF